MKIIRLFLGVTLSVLLFASCSSTKNLTAQQLQDKWVLKSINNKEASLVFADKVPFIIFNPALEQISGNSGCNTFSGKYQYSKGTFQAPNLVSTLMACMNMEGEQEFTRLLGKSSKLSIMNGELIFSQNNKPVMIFSRAQGPSVAELSGVWSLTFLESANASANFNGKTPTLELNFTNQKITGNAGCNTYNGNFTYSKGVLEVAPLITTRMFCPDMSGEKQFLELLQGSINVEVNANTLTLKKGNSTIMVFNK